MANLQRSPHPQKPKFSVAITTEKWQNLIKNTLGDPERCKRFISAITSAVAVNPALQECDAGTILSGALLGESLNLSPSPQLGQYYLIPFEQKVKDSNGKTVWLLDEDGHHIKDDKGKWVAKTEKKAVFVLGYKGYLQLAMRSGIYSRINVLEVKEGELVHYDPFEDEITFKPIQDFEKREAAPTVGYYAMFRYNNGFKKVLYWSKEKMLSHADKYSPAFSKEAYKALMNGEIPDKDMWKYSSFWYKNFDEMAKKTMLRQLISRWGIMSIEMQKAYEADDYAVMADENDNLLPQVPAQPVNDEDTINNMVQAPVTDAVDIPIDDDDDGDLFDDD